mmetsp:Transcript_7538/g.16339  ORF Transcript_7538/g.16339 Transcript_7538/m.16339 type:complete len:146 (-) Transcript_7538:509-946(-)
MQSLFKVSFVPFFNTFQHIFKVFFLFVAFCISANALFASPLAELDRLADGLLDCGLPPPINEIKETLINSFIDPNLRHNKNVSDGKIMARHGDCEVRDFKTDDTGMEQEMQKELYLQAMHIYCDFENGKALKSNYEWPKSKYLSF